MTKKCSGCGQEKPTDEFYAGRGLKCKECKRAYRKRYYQQNKEMVREYNRVYKQSEEYKATRREGAGDLYRKHIEKYRCRALSHYYLKRGQIKRKPCVFCGSGDAEMHHPDYNNPKLVEWLCRTHHIIYENKPKDSDSK